MDNIIVIRPCIFGKIVYFSSKCAIMCSLLDVTLVVFSKSGDFTRVTSSVTFKLIRNSSVSAVHFQQQALINFELVE